MPAIRVRVPASTANLGPGFDCLGLALGLYNTMTFEWGPDIDTNEVTVEGEGEHELESEKNATLSSLRLGLGSLGRSAVAVRLHQVNEVPLARGLGSSATAIVAGLTAARAIAGMDPLDRTWLLDRAMLIEPHPDNIAAAIHGGLTAALLVDEASVRCLALGRPKGMRVALAVPSYRVSTEEARGVLPQQYTREDVVFSASRTAMLVGALTRGAYDLLGEAVRDRIHTPARANLITGWSQVARAARDAGAAGVFISGSGPTVAAFVAGKAAAAERVARAMASAFEAVHVHATPLWPDIDGDGVRAEAL